MNKPTVTLNLRTRQADYIREVARRERISLSLALASVIERYPIPVETAPARRSYKKRAHFVIDPDHLAVLDRMAILWGLTRADAARRIIEYDLERLTA